VDTELLGHDDERCPGFVLRGGAGEELSVIWVCCSFG